MALAAAQVIDAIAALIRTVTGMSAKVHTSRTWPLAESDLPDWRVQAADEAVESEGLSFPPIQRHELDVECHGYARATADLDDALHAMAAAALTKLFASASTTKLSPLNCDMTLRGIERDTVSEGGAALGRVTLKLHVTFHTMSNAPETVL